MSLRSVHLLLLCSILLLLAGPAAALTAYPDVSSGGLDFTGLQEETNSAGDPNPIYGAPLVVGTNLVFSPTNFTSQAQNGSTDITAATFQGMIEVQDKNVSALEKMMLTELGDYSLTGAGSAATSVSVLAGLAVTVLEVNQGGTLSPTALATIDSFFIEHNTPAQGGSWSDTATVDIQAYLDLIYGPGAAFATKLRFTFDNDLNTTSETGTTAFIQKKTGINSITLQTVPEPGTALLLGMGLALLGTRRRA
jgi:hypothetical protein